MSAKSVSSRGQRRPRALGGSGVRELQWKARKQSGGGELRGEAGEALGERKRERTGGRGLKVEDSNFRGVLCIYSCHMASY